MAHRNLILRFAIIVLSTLNLSAFSIKGNPDSPQLKKIQPEPSPIEVVIPEAYELANIILAITDYGISDPGEIHKETKYYDEMMKYFSPFKSHPLLKKVNYSRELWEELLSFRTDAVAFSFDTNGKLKRDYAFHANTGHKPFDNNLDLINDFVEKSNYRKFYSDHRQFYESLVSRYSEYYMLTEMRVFLDSIAGKQEHSASAVKYKIVLSPFVGRMQCHRDLDSLTSADFSDIAHDLVEGVPLDSLGQETRAAEIHTIFTEMDHGYVNPITGKHRDAFPKKFNYKKWDKNSGYTESDCFNEYMTWALYDLFLDRYFPKYSKDLATQWHYQNSSRGFYASSLFADKVKYLVYHLQKGETLESIYPKIFEWCANVQNNLSLPTVKLMQGKANNYDSSKVFRIPFSEPMKKDFDKIDLYIAKTKDGKSAKEGIRLVLKPEDIKWEKNTMLLDKKIPYDEFFILFNWWDLPNPVLSEKGVMLKAQSWFNFKRVK